MLVKLKRIDARPIAVIAIISAFIACTYVVYMYLPVSVDWASGNPSVGVDWKGSFRPAAQLLLQGENPYKEQGFYNPPWVLLPLLPVALLPPAFGSAIMFVLNLFAYLFVIHKLKTNPILITFFVFYSGMFYVSQNGNIEGILALGFILPPQIGLFFLLAKPQFGIAVAAYWGIQALREGGIKQAVETFLPVTIAYLLSFSIFGLWITKSPYLTDVWWNASIFPYGIPVGFGLLGLSIWKKEIRFAIAASPFFAPYLTGHTWAVVWLGMLSLFKMRK